MPHVSMIGGSIAGCLSALVFQNKGFDVQIIERSASSLSDRGAAVVVPNSLFSNLKSLNFIDQDTPHLNHKAVSFRVRRFGIDEDALWTLPTDVIALRWGHLYEQLRKRLDDDCYLSGVSVTDIKEVARGVTLSLNNGTSLTSDLVVAADGIHSTGREHVWGNHSPHYSGYILWRGLLEETHIPTPEILEGVYWAPYNGGLAGAYFIANNKGDTAPGLRTLNWGIYDKMSLDVLATLVPEFSEANASAYRITDRGYKHLLALAEQHLPKALGNVVLKTETPFIQPIVDIVPERLARGRTVLVGDASAVLRPHSASGISKAVQNVLALSEYVSQSDDLDRTISQWEAEQLETLHQQSRLTQSLGAGMVTEAPDWDRMAPEDMPKWWESMLAGKNWFIDDERSNAAKTDA